MKKVAIITGASKGIGWALSKALLRYGFEVIGTSRSGIVPIEHKQFHALQLDITNQESIKNFTESLKALDKQIDLLINNAGIGPDLRSPLPDETSFEQTFNVNVKGTVMLTESIIGFVKKGGMIINVSSKMGSISNCEHSGAAAYRMSKSALNMYTKILSNRYNGIYKIASIHPGWVKTTIAPDNIENATLTPEESAAKMMDFIQSDFRHGIYWDAETNQELEW